jgi:hypothetical protein
MMQVIVKTLMETLEVELLEACNKIWLKKMPTSDLPWTSMSFETFLKMVTTW